MTIAAGLVAWAGVASATKVSGPAVIVDGDTLWVGSQEVRIHGIDAPETSQRCQLPKGTWDCSTAAINALASMTEEKVVRCIGSDVDQYGRLIAKCSTDAVPDIGARLVASGLAWAFVRYSTDYSDLEKGPRAAGRLQSRSCLDIARSKATSMPRARRSITRRGRSTMLQK